MAEGKVAVIDADAVFRTFTACPTDPKTLVIDVRDKKKWDKGHIAGSYCIRLPNNGSTLLDYSKAEYDLKWSADVWWNRDVVVYGEAGLKRDHPVVAFLAADKHTRSVSVYKEGLDAFQKRYPFLITASVRPGPALFRYPSQLDPLLYLGDWDQAAALERHAELGIKAVITIHNNPNNLKLPPGKYSHLKIELADIETADIASHLRPAYDFIEEARAAKRAVLVHCGAGVSRSATLCIAYLMRKHRWSAQKALDFTRGRRSLVAPNDGFWRMLCALEAQLGIAERSNVDAFVGFHGADALPMPVEILNEPKTRVTFIPAGAASAPAGSKAATAVTAAVPAAAAGDRGVPRDGDGERERERRQGRSRSRERERRRSRSHSWERKRRRHSRSRSRDRDGRRRRDGSRERRQSRSRSRDRDRQRRRRSRSGSKERERERRREDERRFEQRGSGGAPAAAAQQAQQQEAEEMVDLESTEGAVLRVLRDSKELGHLVIEVRRVSQECVFGRLPSCDVPLEHLSISRAHAQLTTDGAGNLFVMDLGSAHGTNVDGAWIKAKVPKQLRVGSVIKFGASVREYKVSKLPRPAPRW